jgi:hypothetical protein
MRLPQGHDETAHDDYEAEIGDPGMSAQPVEIGH